MGAGGLVVPPTVGAGIARLADDGRMWGPGLGVWILSVAAGHVLAVATVIALLASGVALQKVWLLALGAIGVIR